MLLGFIFILQACRAQDYQTESMLVVEVEIGIRTREIVQ